MAVLQPTAPIEPDGPPVNGFSTLDLVALPGGQYPGVDLTTQAINELLEQLDRLAGYVQHHGDAAVQGVPVSGDHLVYLGKSMGLAVGQLKSAIQDEEAGRAQRRTALAGLPAGRNAELIEGYARTADLVSRMRFDSVYGFDERNVSLGSAQPGDDGTAMGLIEWFYAFAGRKTVYVYHYDEGPKAIVVVQGVYEGRHVSVRATFRSDPAVTLVKQCAQPSVHLLRRLQLAGAGRQDDEREGTA